MKTYFTKLNVSEPTLVLPEKLNYPFNYQVSDIAKLAAEDLQQYIEQTLKNQHVFEEIGKMFGVLVVRDSNQELGYLSAFSGKLGGKNDYERFVPPVYDMLSGEGFYREEEQKIMEVTREIDALETSNELGKSEDKLEGLNKLCEEEISALKLQQKEAKIKREHLRLEALAWTNEEEKLARLKELDRDSAFYHYELKSRKQFWKEKIQAQEFVTVQNRQAIADLKGKRKEMSFQLQMKLFSQYTFLNADGERKSLSEIFDMREDHLPPSGAGECAAPKLFQYAFENEYTPIALAEFWWGKSPSSEIRKQGYFYPSCRGKCLPILTHMLKGLEVEENPLKDNPAQVGKLDILFEDLDILVINKPHDFLSVPGKDIKDSVLTRLKNLYPSLNELMTVHRLDMSTSGIMLIAKNKNTHKHLQSQFLHRTIQKRYVAILDGVPIDSRGEINLPLKMDYINRPRQMVCFEDGKPSHTSYEVVEIINGKAKVYFYPHTGRTHQLRIHASHNLGLNIPIMGDDLYGKRADRLYLHAERLIFTQPRTGEAITIQVKEEF